MNPVANFFLQEKEKREIETQRNLETKKQKKARPQTSLLEIKDSANEPARNRRLNPKLMREQETRFEGYGMWIERPMTRET